MQWFRFYHEALDDPKVQMLEPALFKTWVNILCLACRTEGKLPCADDIAFALRVTKETVTCDIELLKDAGLLVEQKGALRPHAWSKRQYKSDSSAERTRRYRERSSDVSCDVTETPPDTDTDTDKKNRKKGTRIPEGFPAQEQLDWAKAHGFSEEQAKAEAEEFREHFTSDNCRSPVKKNWHQAWTQWIRRAEKWGTVKGKGQDPPKESAASRAIREAEARGL